MQYALKVFEDPGHEKLTVIDKDGEPWFILNEVCQQLGISSTGTAAARLDDDEKDGIGITDSIGRTQRKIIINESGLYSLILTSRKPEAKQFKKWVTSEVLPSIRKTGSFSGNVPAFIKRYNMNWDRVEQGHFSVCNELVIRLWGRLEHVGHTMADKAMNGVELRPDVSVGRGFAIWLRKNHPGVANEFSYYKHWTPTAEIEARQYPNSMLHLFIEYVDTVWVPENAEGYFAKRDPAALPYLTALLLGPHTPKPGMIRHQTVRN